CGGSPRNRPFHTQQLFASSCIYCVYTLHAAASFGSASNLDLTDDYSANEKSLIQERMKITKETVIHYEMGYDRGGCKDGQEGGQTPSPHTITNGSKLYWHQSLDQDAGAFLGDVDGRKGRMKNQIQNPVHFF
ncbi:hypothetical protein STEG23_011595, partial [Scotinomys teguina]